MFHIRVASFNILPSCTFPLLLCHLLKGTESNHSLPQKPSKTCRCLQNEIQTNGIEFMPSVICITFLTASFFYSLHPLNIQHSSQRQVRVWLYVLYRRPLFMKLLQFLRPVTKSLLPEILCIPHVSDKRHFSSDGSFLHGPAS